MVYLPIRLPTKTYVVDVSGTKFRLVDAARTVMRTHAANRFQTGKSGHRSRIDTRERGDQVTRPKRLYRNRGDRVNGIATRFFPAMNNTRKRFVSS